jgi:hypothetical protein
MKFGAALLKSAAFSAEIADVHACYKAAKKLLKRGDRTGLALLLAENASAWNDRYLDAEENLVIESAELQQLSHEIGADAEPPAYALLRSLVDFHGRCGSPIDTFSTTAVARHPAPPGGLRRHPPCV